MASGEDASETSPLLGQHDNRSTNGLTKPVVADGVLTPHLRESSEDLEQPLPVEDSRDAQFQGAPEIQQKLKYILPALSIGVRRIDYPKGRQGLSHCADLPRRCRSNHHRFQLWKHRQRAEGSQSHQLDCNVVFSDSDLLSATVRQVERHFWPESLLTVRVRCLRSGLSGLWHLQGHQAADSGKGLL